jgi:hypothetical protein
MLGAIAVGCTAWARVSILTEPALRPGAFGSAQPPFGATTKGRRLCGCIVSRLESAPISVRPT